MAKLGRPKKYSEAATSLTIRIEGDERKRLKRAAIAQDTSMTDIAQKALVQYLNRQEGYAKQGKRS